MALHRLQLARFQLAWMVTVVALLASFGRFSLPLFLGASLVGLLLLVEIGTPQHVAPSWIVGLRRFLLVCLVVFGSYVVYRLALLVPAGAI